MKIALFIQTISYVSQGPVYPAVNNKATDGLVIQGARASVAMLLTLFSQNILVSAPEGLSWSNVKPVS